MIKEITIRTQSYVIPGSGNAGPGGIDSDIVIDKYGAPVWPGKRFAGILYESSLELAEYLGWKNEPRFKEFLETVWGVSGSTTEGKVYFDNFSVLSENAQKELRELRSGNSALGDFLNKDAITDYFTSIRRQTSIDRNNRTAKKGSLRTYRTVKPGVVFRAPLHMQNLPESYCLLLQLAMLNLKRAGAGRTGSFGQICVRTNEMDQFDVVGAIEMIKDFFNSSVDTNAKAENTATRPDKEQASTSETCTLTYTVRLKSPAVISMRGGDANTVFTQKSIPGTTLEAAIGRLMGFNSNLFREAVVNKKCMFSYASILNQSSKRVAHHVPLHLHKKKGFSLAQGGIINIFDPKQTSEENASANPTQAIGGLASCEKTETNTALVSIDVHTGMHFHHTRRNNRIEGRSLEGDIFHYEYMESDQDFLASVTGPKILLDEIYKILENKPTIFIGKSKSKEYGGQAVITEFEISEHKKTTLNIPSGVFLVIVESPLLLVNVAGFSIPDALTMEAALQKITGIPELTITKSAVKHQLIDGYYALWGVNKPAYYAYAPGSVFYCETGITGLELPESLIIGEYTSQGHGRVRLELQTKYDIGNEATNPQNGAVTDERLKSILKNEFKKSISLLNIAKATKEANSDRGGGFAKLKNHQLSMLIKWMKDADSFKKLSESLETLTKSRNANNEGRISEYKHFGAAIKEQIPVLKQLNFIININLFKSDITLQNPVAHMVKNSVEQYDDNHIKEIVIDALQGHELSLTKQYFITLFSQLRKRNQK